jgi:hypothetical protein
MPSEANDLAGRVMVVSLMKSGTHLIQELMVALGYKMYGGSRIPAEIRPQFDRETRLKIAEMVYDEDTARLIEKQPDEEFTAATDAAWDAYGWAWQVRLGLPLENRYGAELVNRPLVRQALARTVDSGFGETPPGICWIIPELDIKKVDGLFLQDFTKADVPRMILMYRDPRDVVLSMVNFLCGKTVQGFGNYSEFQVFNRILLGKESLAERLTYALNDPSFPIMGDHERALWLFNHPNVCKVAFEDLVGARGGGSDERQLGTVKRVMEFVGASGADPKGLTDGLYRQDSFSFYKGQIGSWREDFSPEHVALADRALGKVIDMYGYR